MEVVRKLHFPVPTDEWSMAISSLGLIQLNETKLVMVLLWSRVAGALRRPSGSVGSVGGVAEAVATVQV